ncbi:N-acetyltransferase [Microbacterium sp. GXF0217]
MTPLAISPWDGGDAQLASAAELYARTFAEEPYAEDAGASRASFLERIARYADSKPDFRLMLARDDAGVRGLALGTGIVDGDWWRDRIVPLLDEETRARWLRESCFCVQELAVDRAFRRSSVASSLLNALLDDLPYATAVLSRYEAAHAAGEFYAARGWHEIASGIRFGDSPALCVLARDLP